MKTKDLKLIDFTKTPAGRYAIHGSHSGESYREGILMPTLREFDIVNLDLSGAYGFPLSWLEECFGGMYRAGYFSTKSELMDKLKITCEDDPAVVEIIDQYIDEQIERGNLEDEEVI